MQTLSDRAKKAGSLALAYSQAWISDAHRARFALRLGPQPLVHERRKIILIWSPKSACSTALIWFYKQTGLLEAAQTYHANPHNYRQDVLSRAGDYQRALNGPVADYDVIRVIRDPHDRAVSSYRHALRFGYEDRAMAHLTGRTISRREGFSFAEFLEHLSNINIKRCNPHHRLQRHPVEDVLVPRWVINVSRQDLLKELNTVERTLGWDVTNFEAVDWITAVESRRKAGRGAIEGDASETKLSRIEAAPGGAWPERKALLTPERRAEIQRIYAEDFRAYDF